MPYNDAPILGLPPVTVSGADNIYKQIDGYLTVGPSGVRFLGGDTDGYLSTTRESGELYFCSEDGYAPAQAIPANTHLAHTGESPDMHSVLADQGILAETLSSATAVGACLGCESGGNGAVGSPGATAATLPTAGASMSSLSPIAPIFALTLIMGILST